MPYDNRDDIADLLTQRENLQKGGPLAYGLAGLGSAAPPMSSMSGPTLPGLPATPAGGVPGSGMAPTGPSVVQQPPQSLGTMGEMQPIPGMRMRRPRGYA